jgi:putative peptide zinc metalloprotease protein
MPSTQGSGTASSSATGPDPRGPAASAASRSGPAEDEALLAWAAEMGQSDYPTVPDLPALAHMPQLTPGVELLGEYQGSGLTEATYLVRKPGGQVVQVSRLLHLVLSGIDGRRPVNEIAAQVSAAFGRTVSADNVGYLLTGKLAPLGLVPGAEDHATPAGQDQAVLTLKLRRTLVPAAGVQHISRLFEPLFRPAIVAVALAGLIASDAWLVRAGRLGSAFQYVLLHPLLLLMVLGLSVVSMLFHECGHAAACRYGGARPGVIGMGFYVLWPAFFTNVTDAYRLGRAGRIRTDLGGVYFNAVFALGLAGAYLATGYLPLLAAIVVVHLEIVQQLMPSLRLDGYFILADLIGVPDLFRRIGPTLRSMIPGQSADPRVLDLKRAARITLTAWVLLVIPLLAVELTLIILNGPGMVRTFARSLDAQVRVLAADFARPDVPAGLVSVISAVMLILPMAGLGYILLRLGRRAGRAVIAANRRRPILWLPSVAVVLLVAAGLAAHWGLLPSSGAAEPRPSAAGDVIAQRTRPAHTPAHTRAQAPARHRPSGTARRAVVLAAVSAHGFDPLDTQGDPFDENDAAAGYAIDQNPATSWQSQYYLGNPVFGGLKAGSGLILDMGRAVRLRSVTVTFGPAPGADVAIMVGNDDTLAASTLPTFTTVAAADGIGGTHTFRTTSSVRRRYVLIWFTKLPPTGPDKFQAQIFNIVVRGWR